MSMDLDIDSAWTKIEHIGKGVAKEVLGEKDATKDTSWWNEEVRKVIKSKKECYNILEQCGSDVNYEKYEEATRCSAKGNQEHYARLDTKEEI